MKEVIDGSMQGSKQQAGTSCNAHRSSPPLRTISQFLPFSAEEGEPSRITPVLGGAVVCGVSIRTRKTACVVCVVVRKEG